MDIKVTLTLPGRVEKVLADIAGSLRALADSKPFDNAPVNPAARKAAEAVAPAAAQEPPQAVREGAPAAPACDPAPCPVEITDEMLLGYIDAVAVKLIGNDWQTSADMNKAAARNKLMKLFKDIALSFGAADSRPTSVRPEKRALFVEHLQTITADTDEQGRLRNVTYVPF